MRARPRLSYSSVVATIALFLALGGTVYAAATLPKNSVGKKQLRKNAVVSSKVKNGSLLAQDFKAGQLPRGPQGPIGPTGPQGPGAAKIFFNTEADSRLVTLASVGPWTLQAQCVATGSPVVPANFKIFVNGPGSAELSFTEQLNEGTPATRLERFELGGETEIFSFGLKSAERLRIVGTMVLSAGSADPVVSVPFSLLLDEPAQRCGLVGQAIPAT
ncbi:MAG: hypothetical protein JST31_10990 [Actinobacteria bacterium]|nr:hypothetical protein [Actinomycetota bacterium]